jgi:endonuclease-3
MSHLPPQTLPFVAWPLQSGKRSLDTPLPTRYNEGVNSADSPRLRAKIQRVEKILTEYYGMRVWDSTQYSSDVLGALVATVLSQNTSDLNSGRAYASLCAAFPDGWDAVRIAPVSQVAEAIRPGGLSQVKAPRIQAILQDVYAQHGCTNLDHLKLWEDEPIRQYLRLFPGVGPKTAACVLMFNLGRPVLPVDTHVHRVAGRLGLIGQKTTPDAAHEELQALLEEDQVYSFHVHLIEHGRRLCHARRPECPRCPLRSDCDDYQRRTHAEVA